jgi:hypothetical protein
MSETETATPWGDHALTADGDTERVTVGPLTLWFRRVKNELWVTHHRADNGRSTPSATGLQRPSPAPAAPSPTAEWSRWAFREPPETVRLQPVLPDRILVVKPEVSFVLLRRARARIYARVPAWVSIRGVDRSGEVHQLTEIPSVVLSDTWWGDFVDGELAYWLTTKARRALAPELFEPHMIIATIQLNNVSSDDLPVEKLALRVEHLSIFETEGNLWAEEVKVDYRGEHEGSDIRMDDNPPDEVRDAREITPARTQGRGFRARTFSRIKALSGFGA